MYGACRSITPARLFTAAIAAAALAAAAPAYAAPSAPPLLTTTDPATQLPYEWQFDAADVAPALALSPGSPSVVVGTIDSGAASVPDLAGKVDSRWTVSPRGKVTREASGTDYLGHGTAVASLIAANGFGMAGFGGATHIIAMRVPYPNITGASVAAALLKLDALGARIVNMSFGSPAEEKPVVLAAIRKAEADGMLLVAASGNYDGDVAHPAADLQVPNGIASAGIAVGASDVDGRLTFFSNFGANLSLVAPGNYRGMCSGVLVAAPINDDFVDGCYPSWQGAGGASYAYVAGTSFAAPEVAGIAALVWAARPGLTNVQVAGIIEQSARRGDSSWTPTLGCGVLDAGAALALATSRSEAEWALTKPTGEPCSAS
jgi:subtilisin family serine protease